MAGRVAVLVFLSLFFAIAISNESSEECDTSEDRSKEEETEVEINKVVTVYDRNFKKKRKSVTLYVKPGQDFQGVSLEVTQAKNSTLRVWFPIDQSYTDTKWVKLKMTVRTEENNEPYHQLYFELKSGNCEKVCKTSSEHFYNMRLRVVAHGSSTWRCTKPKNKKNIDKQFEKLPFTTNTTQCTEQPGQYPPGITDSTLKPPATTTSPFTSTKRGQGAPSTASPTSADTSNLTIIELAVVGAVVVVVVIVAVVVYCRMRQRRSVASVTETSPSRHPDPATPTRASVHVIENSLYEPFSGPQTPAAREHQEQVQVIENSLYEPFSGPQTSAARGDQKQVHVIENSLYEPFRGPQTQ